MVPVSITALGVTFPIKNLGKLHHFLGVEVLPSRSGLVLSQRKYINDILLKTNMYKGRPVSTPIASGTTLIAFGGYNFSDPQFYRSIVGSLQYLSFTRPDITFAVNKVWQFMHQPKDHHWTAVKRILRYLRGTSHYALHIHPSFSLQLSAFSDADLGGNPDDSRSIGAFAIYFGPNLVAWSSKKQPTVAHSSTEAKYKSIAAATSELI